MTNKHIELPALARYTLSIVADSGYESTTEGTCTAEQYGNAIGALHASPPAPLEAQADMVLVPKRMTKAMEYAVEQEGWAWEDLLAAAESITEDEYAALAAPVAQPATTETRRPDAEWYRAKIMETLDDDVSIGPAFAQPATEPRPLTQNEHEVMRAAQRSSAVVVHPGRLVTEQAEAPHADATPAELEVYGAMSDRYFHDRAKATEQAEAPSDTKRELNRLLNKFAQACMFGDDQTKRMVWANEIHEFFNRATQPTASNAGELPDWSQQHGPAWDAFNVAYDAVCARSISLREIAWRCYCAALASKPPQGEQKPVAFVQCQRSSTDVDIDEDLVWQKDEELEGVLYEYTPLYTTTHPEPVAPPAAESCCANWEAGTSCFADPKQDCPRLSRELPATTPAPAGQIDLCGHCEGSGTVRAMTYGHGPDDYEYDANCAACNGTGSPNLRDAIESLPYQPHSVTPGRQMVSREDVLRIIAARGDEVNQK